MHKCHPVRCYKTFYDDQGKLHIVDNRCKYGYPYTPQIKDSIINGRYQYARGVDDGNVVSYNPMILAVFEGSVCV